LPAAVHSLCPCRDALFQNTTGEGHAAVGAFALNSNTGRTARRRLGESPLSNDNNFRSEFGSVTGALRVKFS